MAVADPVLVAGHEISAGERRTLRLSLPQAFGYADIHLGVQVLRGVEPGPRLLVLGTVHGDEINGAEIIRQVLLKVEPETLAGTLLVVPVVNVYAFLSRMRYLPDRRDLNRSFPGAKTGPLAARLANMLVENVLEGSSHLIDCHSASLNRNNLPQIRADLENPEVLELARAFGAPIMMTAEERPGALRTVANKRGIISLLYEAGTTNRFNREAVNGGTDGILRVMGRLGMIENPPERPDEEPRELKGTSWVRAPRGGFFHSEEALGIYVKQGQRLGFVCDCNGEQVEEVCSNQSGIIIGNLADPQVNEGDAIVHIGKLRRREKKPH